MNYSYFPNRILYTWLMRELRKYFTDDSISFLFCGDIFSLEIRAQKRIAGFTDIARYGDTVVRLSTTYIYVYNRINPSSRRERYIFSQRSIDAIVYKIKTETDYGCEDKVSGET